VVDQERHVTATTQPNTPLTMTPRRLFVRSSKTRTIRASPNDDPVEVTFRFVTLTGNEKEEFLDGLGWDDGLNERMRAVADTHNGRRYERVVERARDPDTELRLLVVEDRNTTGLTGSWDEDSNYAALVRDELYSSKQDDTAGGSYGLGKSVLWTFSGASTVVFNSHLAHGVRKDDSPRLIARSKFPTHQLPEDNTTYQGAGWLCQTIETDDGPARSPSGERMRHG